MVVIAPPRQPDSHDAEFTVEPDRGGEALIEEAKQHARRRRRRGFAVAAIVTSIVGAAAGTAALVAGGADSRSSEPASIEADTGVPSVGLADGEPVDVVASFGDAPAPWVMVFSNGQVLRGGFPGSVMHERWLSPAGLELVRSGEMTARDVWSHRNEVWADDDAGDYFPPEFAACKSDRGGTTATSLLPRLPMAVRAIVSGTQRHVPIASFEQTPLPANWVDGHECFVLDSEEVAAITRLSARQEGYFDTILDFTGQGRELVSMHVTPVLPDGSTVHWGG